MARNHICDPERRQGMYDARRIFMAYVCSECRDRRLAQYRPDVIVDPDYWHDEPIDEDL